MDFLRWTHITGETPLAYGLFHLIFIALTLILSIFFIQFARNNKDKTINKVVFGLGLFLLIIETYKQIFFTFVLHNGDYPWYIFPFQFCSIPVYVSLVAPWIKSKKIQDACYSFLAFYGLLAGVSVMLYPGDVFTSNINISIHSMLWHMTMIIIGCYLISAKNYGYRLKEIKSGFFVYLGFVSTAIIVNVIMFKTYFEVNGISGFNLFYISPFGNCHLPILSTIQANFGWIILVICYILAFTLGVIVIWSIAKLIRLITVKKLYLLKVFAR